MGECPIASFLNLNVGARATATAWNGLNFELAPTSVLLLNAKQMSLCSRKIEKP